MTSFFDILRKFKVFHSEKTGKPNIKTVAVSVAAAATSGSSSADADLVGGTILGYYPTGNQDQLVDNITLNADGSITITLAAAATAENTFNVVVAYYK